MCDLLERVLLPVNVLSLTAVHSLFLVPASSIALCSQLSHPKTLSFVLNLELISHSLTMAINTWRGFNAFMDYCKQDFYQCCIVLPYKCTSRYWPAVWLCPGATSINAMGIFTPALWMALITITNTITIRCNTMQSINDTTRCDEYTFKRNLPL